MRSVQMRTHVPIVARLAPFSNIDLTGSKLFVKVLEGSRVTVSLLLEAARDAVCVLGRLSTERERNE